MSVDIKSWASRFVATPSVSSDGNAEIAELAAELLGSLGGRTRLAPARHQGVVHFAVIADFGPEPDPGSEGLLLLTHLDTVPAGDPELWTETGGDPFHPLEKDGMLFGLGSADAKVDLVCKAAALAELDLAELTRPVRVVGSFAEEIGLVGARWLVDQGHVSGYRFALVGEPSELCAIHAHKGYAVFEARIALPELPGVSGERKRETLRGVSVHSSTPDLGRNAIEAALERLSDAQLRGLVTLAGGDTVNRVPGSCELEILMRGGAERARAWDPSPLIAFHRGFRAWRNELATVTDPEFDPPCSVSNVGRIHLEGSFAVLDFDLRPIPSLDPEQAVEKLSPLARIRCRRANPPLATPRDSPLLRTLVAAQRALGLGERVGTKATCTEAGVLAAAGLEAIVIGAGVSVGNVHRPNEHTSFAQLAQARDLYRTAIERLCGAKPCT